MRTTFEGDTMLYFRDTVPLLLGYVMIGTKWEATANTGGRKDEVTAKIWRSIRECKRWSEGMK